LYEVSQLALLPREPERKVDLKQELVRFNHGAPSSLHPDRYTPRRFALLRTDTVGMSPWDPVRLSGNDALVLVRKRP
jgi:hypothetical protein